MPSANIESDPFFIQLTDALRAGPGSQPWHDAVAALRQQGLEAADEHRLLIEIRENLQAGREYRSVRAGPGFTRKVMAEIENASAVGKPRGIPTATIVAIVCGVLVVSAIGFVIWRMSSATQSVQAMIDDLDNKSQGFVDKVASATFAGAIPDGWHKIGSLKLSDANGLQPDPAESGSKNLGGGVVLSNPIPGNQLFAVDVVIRAPAPTAAILLEAFITTDSKFSPDKGTNDADLVWQLRDKNQQVLSNGGGLIADPTPVYHAGDIVRFVVGEQVAIVEVVPADGGKPQRLWAGLNKLGGGSRYVGVRFLQTGAAGKADISVQRITIAKAPGS